MVNLFYENSNSQRFAFSSDLSQAVTAPGTACGQCDQVFDNVHALMSHRYLVHRLPQTKQTSVVDTIVEEPDMISWYRHDQPMSPQISELSSEAETTPDSNELVIWHCLQCSKVLPNVKALSDHYIVNHTQVLLQCAMCQEEFRRLDVAQDHIVQWHDEARAEYFGYYKGVYVKNLL